MSNQSKRLTSALILLFLSLLSLNVAAHKSSSSYLSITADQNNIDVKIDLAIRDLLNVINLDIDNDGEITWREVKYAKSEVSSYILSNLHIGNKNEACLLAQNNLKIDNHSDGSYLVFYFQSTCDVDITELLVKYTLLFDVDTQHRGLLKIESGQHQQSYTFSPNTQFKTFNLLSNDSQNAFVHFVKEGIWHIWIGFDHILFLISLLLPAVLFLDRKHWVGVFSLSHASMEVVKIVTAFTIAHSITLTIVILSGISLSVVLVESAIAISVVIAALNNLYPIVSKKRWLLGFVFGLIHGFGFANVMAELQLGDKSLLTTLLGFNIGVEIGQLVIVLIFMPLAYLLRNGWVYQNLIFKLGSVSIASIGFIWVIERSL